RLRGLGRLRRPAERGQVEPLGADHLQQLQVFRGHERGHDPAAAREPDGIAGVGDPVDQIRELGACFGNRNIHVIHRIAKLRVVPWPALPGGISLHTYVVYVLYISVGTSQQEAHVDGGPRHPDGERRAETYTARTHATMTEIPRLVDAQIYQRLLEQRIVFIGSEIDDRLANQVNAQLLLLAAQDEHRDITIYINSPGGVVDAGMAIYDMMQFVPNDISTVVMGIAASMGQTLLCAGTPGKRYALRHARVMMHQPHGGIGGTASDIKIQAQQSPYLKRTPAALTAPHTGQTVERIEADGDRDAWFTAEQARDYGFVDHVVDSTDRVGT